MGSAHRPLLALDEEGAGAGERGQLLGAGEHQGVDSPGSLQKDVPCDSLTLAQEDPLQTSHPKL